MEIKTDEIYTMRLANGQEIVAKIAITDDTHYHLVAPLTIGQGQNGQMEFMPVLFCGEPGSDAAMLKDSVSLVMNCRADIKEVYEESLKPQSDVVMPIKKQIITG